MFAEAPYLLSLAALSVSVATLAGLVNAFRRSGEWAAYDRFRLRQIVEFGFANAILALLVPPLVTVTQDAAFAVRAGAVLALAFQFTSFVVLRRRMTRERIAFGRPAFAAIAAVDLAGVTTAAAALAFGTIAAYQLVLLAGLARPMLAFVLVLATIDRGERAA